MISKKLAIEMLNKGLETGADYAEIFFEDTSSYSLSIDNGKVETSTDSESTGVGFRLLKDLQSVYGYTNDLSKKGLMALATNLAASFSSKRILTVDKLKVKKYKTISPINIDYNSISKEEKIALLKEGLNAIDGYDPRIIRTKAGWSDIHKNTSVINSNGDIINNHQQYARAVYIVIASDKNGMESGFEGPGTQRDITFFKGQPIDLKKVALEAARSCITMLDAKECPSGVMPVIVANGFGGTLFHEACGHPLESTAVSKGLSPFAGKLGEVVASPLVSAYDDSTIPNEWGSIDYDDEGVKGEKRCLIKNGVLKGYIIDNFTGRRLKMKGNGACRRQNYRHEPCARMSNTYIDNGTSTPEEIIKATKLGLYTKGFTGGSVNPVTAEFNFTCSEAYIVRDGKICEPVKGAMLIGKGHEILKNIDMVGNDLAFGQGMCGASSGSIRTNVGQPTLRIKEMTVGGRGGEIK